MVTVIAIGISSKNRIFVATVLNLFASLLDLVVKSMIIFVVNYTTEQFAKGALTFLSTNHWCLETISVDPSSVMPVTVTIHCFDLI